MKTTLKSNLLGIMSFVLVMVVSVGAPAQTPVPVGSGSYASTLPMSGAPGDGTYYGPDFAQLETFYDSLYVAPSLKSMAIPTNHWYTDMITSFRGGSTSGTFVQTPFNDTIWTFPYALAPTSTGMLLYYPTGWFPRGSGGVVSGMIQGPDLEVDAVTAGHAFSAPNPVITTYGDWSVGWSETDGASGNSITTYMARGVPFVWANYKSVDPEILVGSNPILNASGDTISTGSGSFTASDFSVTIGGKTFGVYTAPGTTFTVSNGYATPQLGASGYVVYALLPDPSYLTEFGSYAYAEVTGTTMSYVYDRTAGFINTTWTLTTTPLSGGETSTLQGWLPHHYHSTVNNLVFEPFTYVTARGTMQVAAGNTFQISWPFRGIAPVLPAPHTNNVPDDYEAGRMQQYMTQFGTSRPNYVGDTYGQGKELGVTATYMTMADQLGLTSTKGALLANMESLIDTWYTYTPGETAPYFGVLPNWGALIGIPESYGSGDFNDQHFHYGYYAVASALTGMEDPTWLSNWGGMATLVTKEYANWDRTDTDFPYFRTFDIWEGHSWAGGFSSPNGENQESSSESVNSWVGLFLLGNMLGNSAMGDAGAMGYAMETSAVNEYWQDWKHTNFPTTYGLFGSAILASQQIQYQNFFSADPFWEYAIESVPVNHWNDYLTRDPKYSDAELAAILPERAYAAANSLSGFKLTDANNDFSVETSYPGDYILGVQALVDQNMTAKEIDNYTAAGLDVATGADLPGIVYYITQTQRGLGTQDLNYYTNIPTSAVYYNATTGVRTAVVYNPETTAQTATVYNNGTAVTTVSVPAEKLATAVVGGAADPLPEIPTHVACTGTTGHVTVTWTGVANATSYAVYRLAGGGSHYFSGITTTSYTDTGLTNGGTSYTYQVYAVNAGGMSQPSTPVTVQLYGSGAQTATDYLQDFSLVGSMSANWGLDSSNPSDFNGVTSRAERTVDDTEYLIYDFPNISAFTATVYTLAGPITVAQFFSSINNGATFQPIAVNYGTETVNSSGWGYYNITPTTALPTGVTNLEVQFNKGTGNAWDPQLAQMSISYNAPASTPSESVPAAPAGLTATPGNAIVTLNWTAVTGAGSYNLYRGTASGGEDPTPIATRIYGTTYTNAALANGITFYYKLAAVNDGGVGPMSAEVSATPSTGVTAPSAPSGLTAAAANASVVLTWTSGSGAATYNVYRGTTAGGEASVPVGSGITTTTYTDPDLTNGVTYHYKVAAANGGGVSTLSNEASATPFQPVEAPYGGTPWPIPGTIQAANYDTGGQEVGYYSTLTDNPGGAYRTDDVGIEDTSDTGGGYDVGWTATGYWLRYTVNVASAGVYTVGFRVASPSGGTLHLQNLAGDNLTGSVTVPATGGYQTWTTVNATATLPAGKQVLQLDEDSAGWNIHWISFTATDVTLPGAPTDLTAKAADTQIALSWTASSGATSYYIYRGTAAGGESATPLATGVTTTTYINTGLTNGVTYYYKVAAVNQAGTSADSNEASATPAAIVALPPGLTATGGNALVALSWTASAGSTSYSVYRGTTAGGEATTAIVTGVSSTAYTNTGLTNGTTYYYKVAAVNSIGTSALSNEADAKPVAPIAPAPNGLVAGTSSGQATLYWNPSTGATSYDVYRGTAAGDESAAPIAAGLTTEKFVNTGLTDGATYYYKVTAVNTGGTSEMSIEATATPSATSTTVIDPLNDWTIIGSKSANWALDTTYAVDFNGDASAAYRTVADAVYLAYNFPNVTSFWATVYTVSAPSTAITFWYSTNSGSSYTQLTTAVSARTATANSWGYYTYTSSGTLPAGITNLKIQNNYATTTWDGQIGEVSVTYTSAAPAAPTGLTATAGNAQIALSWMASSGATSYNVYRGTTTGGEGSTPVATGVTTTTYTDTGLVNGAKYYFKVAAVDLAGTSPLSAEASATPVAPITSAPNGLVAGSSSGQATLYWNPRSGATSYNVYRGTATGGESSTPIATALTVEKYVNTGLTDGKTYYYKLAAVDTGGTSGLSNEASATPSATSTTVIDPLNDWTIIGSKSANWALDTTYAVDFNGDASAAYRTVADAEYLAYNFPNVTSFWATVYTVSAPSSAVTFWYSTNSGSSYTQLTTAVSARTVTANTWGYYTYTSSGTLPAGITNLKIQNNYATTTWDGQIGEVSITYTPVIPAAPTNLTAAAGNAQVALSWTASSGATSYNVYRSTATGGEGTTPIATGITATAYTNTGLTNRTTYYYKVAAINTLGTSPQSVEASATPVVPPAAIPNGLVAGSSSTQATLYWNPSANAASYDVYRGTTAGGESATPIATGVAAVQYVNTGLTNGTTYYYKVAAVNAAGTSAQSNEASASPSATSTTVVDPLNNWNIVGSKSANWALNTTTLAADLNGDTSCAYRTVADTEYLAYDFPNVTSFWATVYVVSAPSSAISFWYSTNSGSTYTQLTTAVSARTATANTWGYYTYKSSGTLPTGITNLKIQNDYTGTSWDGQIGEVSITY